MSPRTEAAAVEVHPVRGVPEVRPGDDVAALLVVALRAGGLDLRAGDALVVSSKILSKALGLTVAAEGLDGPDRTAAVASQTRRVVAERRTGDRVTRIVESLAGPVMAAAGVDASNTGPDGGLLLLPPDPDAVAVALRSALAGYAALAPDAALGVVVTDTAGRTWRAGQVDFALGCAGLAVLDDLRGGRDADGRRLDVTARAVADEVASAADLVKGKADGVPAALVRGLPPTWFAPAAVGAASLVRTGPGDWFALGHVEALRAALGAPPGSAAAESVGLPATEPEPVGTRVDRAVALALLDVPDGAVDVGVPVTGPGGPTVEVALSAGDPVELGRLLARLETAAVAEGLRLTDRVGGADEVRVRLR